MEKEIWGKGKEIMAGLLGDVHINTQRGAEEGGLLNSMHGQIIAKMSEDKRPKVLDLKEELLMEILKRMQEPALRIGIL